MWFFRCFAWTVVSGDELSFLELSLKGSVVGREFAMTVIEWVLNYTLVLLCFFTDLEITMHAPILEVTAKVGGRAEEHLDTSAMHAVIEEFSKIKRTWVEEKQSLSNFALF